MTNASDTSLGRQTPAPARAHRLRPMSGRNPDEHHRSATPLELLYDLTFVVAFGTASNQLAHLLAEGHVAVGVGAFSFATFVVCWAWINFSWFASAYDTDDWAFRVATMVQMVGVIILALGIPTMFHSLDEADRIDNGVAVAGYVVIRVAMISLWLRASRQDPRHRRPCLAYATTIGVAQVGWVVLIVLSLPTETFLMCGLALVLIEMLGPVLAERKDGGTPWHAHHLAERFGLLAIITLGEGVIGTVASLSAAIEHQGWSVDAVLIVIAGIGLTFGIWWVYFLTPSAEVLRVHRERVFGWAYSHILIFGSIVATGAGLHVAASYIEHEAHLSASETVLAVAIPVAVFVLTDFGLYTLLLRSGDLFHIGLLVGTVAALILPVILAAQGVSMAACLVVLTAAPLVTVIGYETIGHRHQTEALARMGGPE